MLKSPKIYLFLNIGYSLKKMHSTPKQMSMITLYSKLNVTIH